MEGVTYLTPADQEALPYRIVSLLPWNHFGRKNVGYLYAVHHGAKVRTVVHVDGAVKVSARGECVHGTIAHRLRLSCLPGVASPRKPTVERDSKPAFWVIGLIQAVVRPLQ